MNPQTNAMVMLEINWDPNAVVCNCTLAAGKQTYFRYAENDSGCTARQPIKNPASAAP